MTAVDVPDYHLARLLLLVEAFSDGNQGLEGMTKLAKLDFLLRYPVFLERLLDRRNLQWPLGLAPTDAERQAVESRMIRYKYGPWDSRYHSLIGALVGRGLLVASVMDDRVALTITPEGRTVARELAGTEAWRLVAGRCALLRRSFNRPGNQLKTMIYRELPDAVDRPYWSPI